jgi:hypothetical protein
VAPVVSEARTLDRFIGPAQERLWALAGVVAWIELRSSFPIAKVVYAAMCE